MADTTTDANGKYEFEIPENGTYRVTPTKDFHTFSPAYRDIVVDGDPQVVDNMVGTEFLTLPWSYDVSDVTPSSGNIASQLADWVVGPTYNDGDIVSTGLADTNGFTPSGVTKAFNMDQSNSEYIDYSFAHVIATATTSIRISYLIRDTTADDRVGICNLLDPVGTDQSQILPLLNAPSNPDEAYLRARYGDGSTVIDANNDSLGANIVARRWHWIRFEWNWTDDKVRLEAVRVEDSSTLYSFEGNMHASGIALGHVPPGLSRIRLGGVSAGTDSLYAKLWLGTADDAWPT